MSKQIQLTQGKIAIVDDKDFDRLNAHKWCAEKQRTGKFYAARGIWIPPIIHHVYMHREIMNAPKGLDVDHIREQDTLDNRRSNLRLATRSQNMCNQRKRKDNISGYKGVHWHNQAKKWQAQININGKGISLGLYSAVEDAARAYDAAAIKYHGEFAKTNF
jgi:hypothetical protein